MKTEPNAEMRRFAAMVWQQFVALQDAGFSERQALIILGHELRALFTPSGGGDDRRKED